MATTYVNFHGGITQNTAQNFMSVLSQKITAGTDHFYILLSTQGGDIQSGMTMYNFLRAVPARITVHNIGSVDSVGNAVFLAANADDRFACAHSTFKFHGAELRIQNLAVEEKRAREILNSILADQNRIADIISQRTNIGPGSARKLFREATAKHANAALAAGIIRKICDPNIPAGSDIVSFVFSP
jgi:ATP-dependent protease ClpP protease subunit